MIEGKKVLAIIPARGGSKGIPRKNIHLLAGKPLIAWTIEEAKKSQYIDRLILSSEDEEIIAVAKTWGCDIPFVRPKELAEDTSPGIAPVLHAIGKLPGYDYVVLLQPTSPMRQVADIDGCIEKCLRQHATSCVSVTEVAESPYWMFQINGQEKLKPLLKQEDGIFQRRQDLPKAYVLNGAIYVAETEYILQNKEFISKDTKAFVMPKERSIDIDSYLDFKYAELTIEGEEKE